MAKHKATSASEPSAFASLKSLEQALQDQGCGANGKDYHEDALERAISRKRQAKADREIRAIEREYECLDFNGPEIVKREGIIRTVVLPPYPTYPKPKAPKPINMDALFSDLVTMVQEFQFGSFTCR